VSDILQEDDKKRSNPDNRKHEYTLNCHVLMENSTPQFVLKYQRYKTYKIPRFLYILDVHKSVHHNINLIEMTNKIPLCRTIYYSLTAEHVSSYIITHHHKELLNCNYSFWFYSRLSFSAVVMTAAGNDKRE
jgi:hypothetical protein